jgi:hypothetical protein
MGGKMFLPGSPEGPFHGRWVRFLKGCVRPIGARPLGLTQLFGRSACQRVDLLLIAPAAAMLCRSTLSCFPRSEAERRAGGFLYVQLWSSCRG